MSKPLKSIPCVYGAIVYEDEDMPANAWEEVAPGVFKAGSLIYLELQMTIPEKPMRIPKFVKEEAKMRATKIPERRS